MDHSRSGEKAKRPRTAPKKQAKQRRSRATVETVLEAATRVLTRVGYERTTTTEIAEVAGVSIGSLYQYFPGKEAIVAALLERHAERMFALVEIELEAAGELALPKAVHHLVGVLFAAYAIDPKLRRLFLVLVPHLGRPARVPELETRLLAVAVAFLEKHRGALRKRELQAAAYVALHAVAALAHGAVVTPPEIPQAVLVDEISDLVCRYLFP